MIKPGKRFERRKRRTRYALKETNRGRARLSVFRSSKHIYAQVIVAGEVQASASSLEKDMRGQAAGNVEGAKRVGQLIAERAKTAGIETVAFDRSGFRYHGRVKALAEAAREGGLKF